MERIRQNRPFLGICVALQSFFEGSEESPGVAGLGILPGQVKRLQGIGPVGPAHRLERYKAGQKDCSLFNNYRDEKLYFVHSYHVPETIVPDHWRLTTTDYGEEFVSGICQGNIAALQFHPEKSGPAGLQILDNFLSENVLNALEQSGVSISRTNQDPDFKTNYCLS